jgi:large subunit ribosomal protein L17
MRHYKKGRKLGTDASHTKAMKKNLVVNLFANDRIKTTLERAKEIRGDVDRVITWAKRGDVHSRRLAIAKLGDKDLVAEIFSKVAQGMFEGRPGGYSRIMRLGTRRGDSATIVIMELVLEPLTKKAAKEADEKPAAKRGIGRKSAADKAKGAAKAKDESAEAEAATDEAEAAETEAETAVEAEEAVATEGDEAVEGEAAEATEADSASAEAATAEPEVIEAEVVSAEATATTDATDATPAEEASADEAPAEDSTDKAASGDTPQADA